MAHRVQVRMDDRHMQQAVVDYLQSCAGLTADSGNIADVPAAATIADRPNYYAQRSGKTPMLLMDVGPCPEDVTPGDFVECPIRLSELLHRVWGRLRAGECVAPHYRIGPVDFQVATRELMGAGRTCTLVEQEAKALSYLCKAGARVVPRTELLRVVWGYAPNTETHTVETHIWQLRAAFQRVGASDVIRHRNGGYCLVPTAVLQ